MASPFAAAPSRLRSRRALFWYLAPDRIVAALVARSDREPVLEACAASYSAPVGGGRFAPGVIEVSWVLHGDAHPHVAALASSFCRVESGAASAPPPRRRRRWGFGGPAPAEAAEPGERSAVAHGEDAMRIFAPGDVVGEAAGLFRRARLELFALDCEACALASLSQALGATSTGDARRQHLSAVSVLPDAETAAEALGDDLAVPVGLAIAWFGGRRAL